MEILITRHGETNANKREVNCGWYNSSLTKVGKEQAKKLASRLEKEKIEVILCSDLNRCKQTISPYLAKHNKEIHYDKLLREQCYGVFEGKPTKSMIEWFKNNPGKEPEGWESKEQLKERISKFITQVLPKYADKNVLIVTHGRTKRMILEILLANSPEHHEKIKVNAPNTGLTIIEFPNKDNKNPVLKLHNCDKHIK
jgi:broad specificity phosphatase PhoE